MLDTTHHAHLVIGDPNEHAKRCAELLTAANLPGAGDPDFYALTLFDKAFGIDDAHDAVRFASRRAFGNRGKVLFLSAPSFTLEAQNALLKVCEEPTEGTHIVLVAREPSMLVPTLISRMRVYGATTTSDTSDADSFQNASYSARLKHVSRIAESDNARSGARALATALLKRAAENPPYTKRALSVLVATEKFLHNPSMPVKTVLEGLALLLPRR